MGEKVHMYCKQRRCEHSKAQNRKQNGKERKEWQEQGEIDVMFLGRK